MATHVLFIIPEQGQGISTLLGVSYISSLLKSQGHHVDILNFALHPVKKEVISEKLRSFSPRLIGITMLSTHSINQVKYIAHLVKELCDIPVIIGGPAVTIDAASFLDCKDIDMICIGEGEYPMLELCDKINAEEDYSGIKSLWIRNDEDWIKNDIRPLEDNIDKLPFPDRSLFPVIDVMFILATRGCPYDCSYCINKELRQLYRPEKYLRYRSPENVISEILEIKQNYSFSRIWFYDDRFPTHKEWIESFVELYKKNSIGIPFSINIRPEEVSEKLVKNLKKAGLSHLRIGVEAGDENIREKILNRKYSNSVVKNAFKIAKKYQVFTKAYNIIGIPGETARSILKTMALNIKINPGIARYSIFQPYPGTVLGRECREKRYILKDVSSIINLFSESGILTEHLHPEDIKRLQNLINFVSARKKLLNLLGLLNEKSIVFLLNCFYRINSRLSN